jgi:hypothetical protein
VLDKEEMKLYDFPAKKEFLEADGVTALTDIYRAVT